MHELAGGPRFGRQSAHPAVRHLIGMVSRQHFGIVSVMGRRTNSLPNNHRAGNRRADYSPSVQIDASTANCQKYFQPSCISDNRFEVQPHCPTDAVPF